MSRTITLAIAFLLALCAHAQSSKPVTADELPPYWIYAQSSDTVGTAVLNSSAPADEKWWKTFNDPLLDSLVDIAFAANYDVAIATRRIELARQSLRQARSGYFPTIDASAGWSRARSSGLATSRHGTALTTSAFDLGVDLSWEADVFGKVRAKAKEAKFGVDVSRAEYDAVMLSVAAKVTTAYLQLRTVQAQISVLEHNIESQAKVLAIAQARFEAGIADKLDVSQASTTYYSTVASLTSLRTEQSRQICSLAILLGRIPHDIRLIVQSKGEALPDYHRVVAVGVPMDLLRRRPDLLEAERTIDQNAAAIGVAKSAYLPSLTLTGSVFTEAHDGRDLFKKESLGYTIAPTLSWTVFDGGSRAAATETARIQMSIAIENYNLTLLTAVSEAQAAMVSYINDLQYVDTIARVLADANESLTLSLDLYKQGLTDFVNVTDAQISVLQYASEMVKAHGAALTDLVTLYQSLGGTF